MDEKSTPQNHQTKAPKILLLILVALLGIILIVVTLFLIFFLVNGTQDTEQYLSQGQHHLQETNYDQAITAFLRVIKTNHGSIPARLGLAKAYLALAQFGNAENRLLKILDIDPLNREAHQLLQDLYSLSGDYEHLQKTITHMRQKGLEQDILYGNLTGKIVDGTDIWLPEEDLPIISDAEIVINLNDREISKSITDQNGMYSIFLKQNTFVITIKKTGYSPYTQDINIQPDNILYMPTISLAPAKNQTLQSGPIPDSHPPITVSFTSAFEVTYNYAENGGVSATQSSGTQTVGKPIDLTPQAHKEGWEFIGWNTNKNAEKSLSTLPMGPDHVTLYAIYKKTLKAICKDINGTTPVTREIVATLYNNTIEGTIILPEQNAYTGNASEPWLSAGWAPDPTALGSASPSFTSIPIRQNMTFYGIYKQQISLTYDGNGSLYSPSKETRTTTINSANIANTGQIFNLAPAITRTDYTFVGWALNSPTGTLYKPGDTFVSTSNATMYAVWE